MNLFMSDPTIWVLVSFVIFIIGAFVFGRKTVLNMLDAKIDNIKAEISNAESLRDQAQRLLQEYETKQKAAQSEAEKMLEAARKQAAELHAKADSELTETLARRESMMADRIKRMEEAAMDDIRRYAADLAISATKEIISQKLDQASANRLAEDSIRKVSGNLN